MRKKKCALAISSFLILTILFLVFVPQYSLAITIENGTILNMSITSPKDESILAIGTVWFNFTVSENNLDTCSLWTNETSWGPRNNATASELMDSGYNFTFTFSDDGVYLWNIECNDSGGNSAFDSTNFTIKIDTTPPTITITSPANDFNFTTRSIRLNLTTNENATCSYYLENCSRYETSNVTDILDEFESRVYNLSNRGYDVMPRLVEPNIAKFRVNGEDTDTLLEGSTYYLRDGSSITLIDAVVQNFGGGIRWAKFTLTTPASGCSMYEDRKIKNMTVTGGAEHSELITGVNDISPDNEYYSLTTNCTDHLLNSNTNSVTFYLEATAPALYIVQSSFITNNSAIITWHTSESSDGTVEYGLNDSYGFSVKNTSFGYHHTVVLGGLQQGTTYYYRVRSSDSFGNENVSEDYSFTTQTTDNIKQTIIANETNTINSSITNTSFEIVTNGTVLDAGINITSSKDSPTNKSLSVNKLKYLDINVNKALSQVLSYALIKIYYTDDELAEQNLSESSLGIYWYDSMSNEWSRLDSSMSWVFGVGVDQVNNYVWANVSHLSSYSAGGLIQNDFACTSNSQCVSDYCNSGICSTPSSGEGDTGGAPGGGGGGGGSTLAPETIKNETNQTEAKETLNKTVKKEENVSEEVETSEVESLNLTGEEEETFETETKQPGLFGRLFNRITGGVVGVGERGKLSFENILALAILVLGILLILVLKRKQKTVTI